MEKNITKVSKNNLITWILIVILIVFSLAFSIIKSSSDSASSEKTRFNSITKQLRCLECEGLSVYDSETPISVAIKNKVKKEIKDGKSDDEIIAGFVDVYGEFVRLSPTGNDGNWAIYVFPILFVVALLLAIYIYTRKNNQVKIPKFKVHFNIRILFWVSTTLIFCTTLLIYQTDISNVDNKMQTVISNEVSSSQDPEDVKKALESALKSNPTATNYRAMGIFLFAQGDLVEAYKNLDTATELDPNDATSNAFASYIVFRSGQYESARLRSIKALEIDPNNVPALFYHGLILREIPTISNEQSEQYLNESNENFDAVIRLDPTSEFARQINEIRT